MSEGTGMPAREASAKTCPGFRDSEEMVAVVARDYFVDGLGSQQVQIYVKQAHPVDVQTALATGEGHEVRSLPAHH